MRAPSSLIAFLAAASLGLLAGCSGAPATGPGSTDASAVASPTASPTVSESTPPAVEVDEGLLTVDLRLRRSLLDPEGTKTDDEIIEGARDKGIDARIDGDVVIYTMTRAQQQAMLDEMRTGIKASVEELVADDGNSFSDIESNDNFTEFTVKVDSGKYTAFESLYALALYVPGALFQQSAGVDPDDVDVLVEFVDDASGEVLNTGSYRKWLESTESE